MPPEDVVVGEVRVPVPLLETVAVWFSEPTLEVFEPPLGIVAARVVALYTESVAEDPHFSSGAAAQFEVQ